MSSKIIYMNKSSNKSNTMNRRSPYHSSSYASPTPPTRLKRSSKSKLEDIDLGLDIKNIYRKSKEKKEMRKNSNNNSKQTAINKINEYNRLQKKKLEKRQTYNIQNKQTDRYTSKEIKPVKRQEKQKHINTYKQSTHKDYTKNPSSYNKNISGSNKDIRKERNSLNNTPFIKKRSYSIKRVKSLTKDIQSKSSKKPLNKKSKSTNNRKPKEPSHNKLSKVKHITNKYNKTQSKNKTDKIIYLKEPYMKEPTKKLIQFKTVKVKTNIDTFQPIEQFFNLNLFDQCKDQQRHFDKFPEPEDKYLSTVLSNGISINKITNCAT